MALFPKLSHYKFFCRVLVLENQIKNFFSKKIIFRLDSGPKTEKYVKIVKNCLFLSNVIYLAPLMTLL